MANWLIQLSHQTDAPSARIIDARSARRKMFGEMNSERERRRGGCYHVMILLIIIVLVRFMLFILFVFFVCLECTVSDRGLYLAFLEYSKRGLLRGITHCTLCDSSV